MPGEEDAGFTFVDKRGASDSVAESAAGTPSGQPSEPAGHPGAHAAQSPFQVPHLSTADRILMCINWLHEGAWIALGLVHDPATEKIEKDLDAAKTAIDCIAFLSEKVDSSVDSVTRRDLQNLVQDLRLNFVQQQGRS